MLCGLKQQKPLPLLRVALKHAFLELSGIFESIMALQLFSTTS